MRSTSTEFMTRSRWHRIDRVLGKKHDAGMERGSKWWRMVWRYQREKKIIGLKNVALYSVTNGHF